jgi:hypothetical protein
MGKKCAFWGQGSSRDLGRFTRVDEGDCLCYVRSVPGQTKSAENRQLVPFLGQNVMRFVRHPCVNDWLYEPDRDVIARSDAY